MSVNLDSYKTFYYVAKYRNITHAAKALFQTQPTVSRCIAGLEAELGCRLFVRSKKGVMLTPGSGAFIPAHQCCLSGDFSGGGTALET